MKACRAILRPLILILMLLGGGLAANPAEEPAAWQLAPRLARGQEFVYRGTLREQSQGRGVQFHKTWKLDLRALVIESKANGAHDVAFLTRLTPQRSGQNKGDELEATHVRLDLAEVDSVGKISAPAGVSSTISLEGLTTWEHGFLIEFPRTSLTLNQDWLVTEKDRPGRKYRIMGTENLAQASCVKVVGEQMSADWNLPRSDSTAWRRRDTVFILPKYGVAQRVVRDLERRDPAHREATYRFVIDYELESSWKFDGNLFDDRKREIAQIKSFQDTQDSLLGAERVQGKDGYLSLLSRIDQHAEKHPATPYREALSRLRSRTAELAQNPGLAHPAAGTLKERLAVGKAAPEFVVNDLHTRKSVSLRNWHSKTLLMVFYHPASDTSAVVLRQTQRLADRLSDPELAVVGFSMSEDVEAVKRLESALGLTFPALAGGSLRQSYEVDATPRIVIVDRAGIVRAAMTGWGPEALPAIEEALAKCRAAPQETGKPPR